MKMIDLINGRKTARVCPYCEATGVVVNRANIDVSKYHCIAPRHRETDECRHFIDEPCMLADYEVCLVKTQLENK